MTVDDLREHYQAKSDAELARKTSLWKHRQCLKLKQMEN